MNTRLTYIYVILWLIACNSKKPVDMENKNIGLQYDKKVTLSGIYTKSILSKKGQAGHTGHYKIIVNDSVEVILLPPYLKEAVRSKEEVRRFEGKRVSVTGIISKSTFLSAPSLEDQPLTVNIPCFIEIESIHLAKE